MNRNLVEVLLLVSVAMNAALLTFIAGVLAKVMNDMDEPAFKDFSSSLYHSATRSPFMITIMTIPFVGAIPYFYFYGFSNRWIAAGLALWFVAGSIAKMIKLPIFKTIAALDNSDAARLGEQRQKLNAGNFLQATLSVVAAALMTVPFIGR